jgi:ubiquinone/menaquinone biosynthesis C-methylase UbiE
VRSNLYLNKSGNLFFSILLFCSISVSCTQKKTEQKEDQPTSVSAIDPEDTIEDKEFEQLIEEYESKDRDEWQQPEIILKFLGNLKGKKVADIGAGTGYFSFKLARQADTVYAIDIDQRFLDYIEQRKEGFRDGLGQNVLTILSREENPGLFPKKVDLVLLVNTYSYLDDRIKYLKEVKKIILKNGALVIVDFKEKNTPIGPPNNLKVSADSAIFELKQSGFQEFVVDSLSLPYQYIIKAS